jgi:hypothetical protein
MNNLNVKCDTMERTQKEVKRLTNIINAESKILSLMIEEILKRGVTI